MAGLLDLAPLTNQAVNLAQLAQMSQRTDLIQAERELEKQRLAVSQSRIEEDKQNRLQVNKWKTFDEIEKLKDNPELVFNPNVRAEAIQRQFKALGIDPVPSKDDIFGAFDSASALVKAIRDQNTPVEEQERLMNLAMVHMPKFGEEVYKVLGAQQKYSQDAERHRILVEKSGPELRKLNKQIGELEIRQGAYTEFLGKTATANKLLEDHRGLLTKLGNAETQQERDMIMRQAGAEWSAFDLERTRLSTSYPIDIGRLNDQRADLIDKRTRLQELGQPIPPELESAIVAYEASAKAVATADLVLKDPTNKAYQKAFKQASEDLRLKYNETGRDLKSTQAAREDLRERALTRLEEKDATEKAYKQNVALAQAALGSLPDEEQTVQKAAELAKLHGNVLTEDVLKANPLKFKKAATEVNIADRKFSPEQAGRVSAINRSLADLSQARSLLVKDDGAIDRTTLFSANLFGGLPFSKGRDLNRYIEDAVETKLRLETGAAANKDEIRRIATRFKPSVKDADETIKGKLDQLEVFMRDAFNVLDPTGEVRARIGGQSAGTPPTPGKQRFEQIQKQHKDWSKEQVFQQMIQEGY